MSINNHIRDSRSYRVFTVVNTCVMIVLCLLGVLPFVHILAISFSQPGPAAANLVGLWPVGFNVENYKLALNDPMIIGPFFNSIRRVVLGLIMDMTCTILMAYPLCHEKAELPGRGFYITVLMITMLFSGGLIPDYMLMVQLNLMDTIWALILRTCVPVFNITVLMNFFRGLPRELEESAFIDGAGYTRTLVYIYLPLSVPSLATLSLFVTIGHWNGWFDGLMYMRNPENYPLMTYLQVVLTQLQELRTLSDAERLAKLSQRGLMMTYIIVSLVPIMIVYPFLQRHIRSGLVLGSVKG